MPYPRKTLKAAISRAQVIIPFFQYLFSSRLHERYSDRSRSIKSSHDKSQHSAATPTPPLPAVLQSPSTLSRPSPTLAAGPRRSPTRERHPRAASGSQVAGRHQSSAKIARQQRRPDNLFPLISPFFGGPGSIKPPLGGVSRP